MKQLGNTRLRHAAAGFFPFLALLLLTAGVHAQARWVRLESENKEISFAVPEDYLVSVERAAYSKTKSVAGFEGGVSIEIKIAYTDDAKDRLGRVMTGKYKNASAIDFELDGMPGKMVTYSDKGFEQTIYMASKKAYYILQVAAPNKDAPEVSRFLRSIRVKGNAMVTASTTAGESEDDTVLIESLQVSSEVKEALDRKAAKSERKITYEPLSAFVPCRNDDGVRPAFLVSHGKLELSSIRGPGNRSGEIKLNVQFLANGQVGDIVVFSDLDKSVLRAFAESAGKTRFVQAKNNGTLVDWCETILNSFGVTTGIRVFTISGE